MFKFVAVATQPASIISDRTDVLRVRGEIIGILELVRIVNCSNVLYYCIQSERNHLIVQLQLDDAELCMKLIV